MNPPPTPQPKESKPSRWKRGCLITGIVFVLLVPAFYWFENYTGRRALEKEVQEYAVLGFPLEEEAVFPVAVPDSENFGVAPLLNVAKWEALTTVLPYRGDSHAPVIRTIPKPGPSPASPAPLVRVEPDMNSIHKTEPVWANIRAFLLTRTTCTPPADETSDVRAVYESLEIHNALFAELTRQFVASSSLTRLKSWHSDTSNRRERLSRLLLLRARAAAVLGKHEESAVLVDVLWKLRSVCLVESNWAGHAVSNDIERSWVHGVRTILRGSIMNDDLLKQLLATSGDGWSPEKELQHSFHGEALSDYNDFKDGREQAFGARRWLGFSDLQEKMLRFGPSGWVERNLATSLRYIRTYVLSPLETGNFRNLPPAMEALDAEIHNKWGLGGMNPSTFLGLNSVHSLNFYHYVFVPCSVRLTLLAIAMERYRLKHSHYPADGTALVPDCIAAVPPDIDGAPLRIVTSPDGATSVLYSIGWNLTDDWHGVLPSTYKEENDWQNADWPLSLPLPPLPPP